MEQLGVMVRTTGRIPRQRSDAGDDRRRTRIRRAEARGTVGLRPVRQDPGGAARRGAACASGSPVRHVPVPVSVPAHVPVPVAATPERPSRTRACLVPPRATRTGAARHDARSRTDRLLIGVATVLCSAVAVVVLGLIADASAGRSDVPVGGASMTVAPVPDGIGGPVVAGSR